MIFTACYYMFFASAVILYGVGLNTATIICDRIHELTLPLIKIFLTVISAASLTWVLLKNFLIPLGLTELYPLVTMMVFIIIALFVESLIRIVAKKVTSEFSLSYLIVVVAISQSLNILDVLLISASCFVSFLILIPVIYSIRKRIDLVGNINIHGNRKSLILVSIAVIVTTLAVGNVSWLNGRLLP